MVSIFAFWFKTRRNFFWGKITKIKVTSIMRSPFHFSVFSALFFHSWKQNIILYNKIKYSNWTKLTKQQYFHIFTLFNFLCFNANIACEFLKHENDMFQSRFWQCVQIEKAVSERINYWMFLTNCVNTIIKFD